jgi:hypothetical protein
MNSQDIRNLQEAYLNVYEQETGRGPRISDTYDMRDAEGGPKGGGTIKGPKMKNVIRKEETDLYDIILSHLINEGYADNEEAALQIMANMGGEWIESIVEGAPAADEAARRAAQQNAVGAAIQTNPEAFADAARKEAAARAKRRREHLAKVDKNNR